MTIPRRPRSQEQMDNAQRVFREHAVSESRALERKFDSRERRELVCDEYAATYLAERPTIDTVIQSRPVDSQGRPLYKPEVVRADKAFLDAHTTTTRRAEGISNERFERARVAPFAEAFLARRIAEEQWFGSECKTAPTTKFDDVKNGVDFVLQWYDGKNSDSIFQIAVDVTTTQSQERMRSNIEDIERKIAGVQGENGRMNYLSEIRYYRSPHTGRSLRLTSVPRVVLALTSGQLERAMDYVEQSQRTPEVEREAMIDTLITECERQLNQQLVLSMIQIAEQLGKELSVHKDRGVQQLQTTLMPIVKSLTSAATTGGFLEIAKVYDELFAFIEGDVAAKTRVSDRAEDYFWVARSIIPAAARIYQTRQEQQKRLAKLGKPVADRIRKALEDVAREPVFQTLTRAR